MIHVIKRVELISEAQRRLDKLLKITATLQAYVYRGPSIFILQLYFTSWSIFDWLRELAFSGWLSAFLYLLLYRRTEWAIKRQRCNIIILLQSRSFLNNTSKDSSFSFLNGSVTFYYTIEQQIRRFIANNRHVVCFSVAFSCIGMVLL